MADVFKILGQKEAPTVYQTLYRVPSPAATTVDTVAVGPKAISIPSQALVNTIMVCNIGTVADDFTIRIRTNADIETTPTTVEEDYQLIFNAVPIYGISTRILKLGLTLSAGDAVEIKATTIDKVSMTAMGIEVT